MGPAWVPGEGQRDKHVLLFLLLWEAPMGACVEDGVLRLRQERSVTIALPAGAWLWLQQNISPSDSAVLLSGGTNGSSRAWQHVGDVFGVLWVVLVVRVALSSSSLAVTSPNPCLSLRSSCPGSCGGINGTKDGSAQFYWSPLQFVHLNDLFVRFTSFHSSRFKELIEYFSLSQRCLKLLPSNNLLSCAEESSMLIFTNACINKGGRFYSSFCLL